MDGMTPILARSPACSPVWSTGSVIAVVVMLVVMLNNRRHRWRRPACGRRTVRAPRTSRTTTQDTVHRAA